MITQIKFNGEDETACKNRRGFLWPVWHFVKSDTIIHEGLDTLWATQDQLFWEFDLYWEQKPQWFCSEDFEFLNVYE